MANRKKGSVSLPAQLDVAIGCATMAEGTTVSESLAEAAARRRRLDAGRRGVRDWERENGPLTTEELADGVTRARALLWVERDPLSTSRKAQRP